MNTPKSGNSREAAIDEIVADGCEMMLRRTKVMQMMAEEKPSLFETIKEWLSGWIEKLEAAFEGVEPYHKEARSMLRHMEQLQEMWDRGLAKAVTEPVDSRRTKIGTKSESGTKENTAIEGGVQFLVREIGNTGMYYVKANRQVLFGNDPEEWGEQLTRYINKEIRKGNNVPLSTADGEVVLLTAVTAEKGAFRNLKKENGKHVLQSDTEYETKLNAEAHIDELIQISKDQKPGKPNSTDYKKIYG